MHEDPTVRPPLQAEVLRRIDELCDQFETALAAGHPPALEELLDQVESWPDPGSFNTCWIWSVTTARSRSGR